MGTPRPKYIANRRFIVGTRRFNPGEPVAGGRALELGIRHGFVDQTSRRGQSAAQPTDTNKPETAEHQEPS